jgi:formate dehydrogenase major subunit
MDASTTNRRQFFRGAGMTVGTLAGLGLDLKPARAAASELKSKLKDAREFASVCPYCAVGCGQIVSVRDQQIVNIEGNPDSPISRGTLCPKGSATYQLAVNPNRLTKVKYRAPFATEWEEKPLDFQERWQGKDMTGKEVDKVVNHCSTIASLGGATMDNEWNYVHLKLWRALGLIWLENQARI